MIIALIISALIYIGVGYFVGQGVRDMYVNILFGWAKKMPTYQWLLIVAVVFMTGWFITNAGNLEIPDKMEAAKVKPGETETYIIAKQFARDQFGSADLGWVNNGFTDYGDGTYHVSGVADVPGKRYYWTIELRFNGGEWTEKGNWTNKGFEYR